MNACQFIMKDSLPLGFITSFTRISFLLPTSSSSWEARRTTTVQSLPSSFFGFLHLIYRHLVGLLGRGGSAHHTPFYRHRKNADIQECPNWDSNLRYRCSSGRRQYNPYTTRPLWSAPAANWTPPRIIPLEKLTVAQIVYNSCYQRTDAYVKKSENIVLASWRNVFTCNCLYDEQFSEAVHDNNLCGYVSASSAGNLRQQRPLQHPQGVCSPELSGS